MSFQEALLALPPLDKGTRTHAILPESAAEWASHHRVRLRSALATCLISDKPVDANAAA